VRTLVFFYGTLMTGFDRRQRAGIDDKLRPLGRGSIRAALFDLGPYPAAVPADEGRVWGEVYEVNDAAAVLAVLDEIEGYSADDPDGCLYKRIEVDVVLEDRVSPRAYPERALDLASRRGWVYLYGGPIGEAPRIPSGDYREYLKNSR
jgi:gamma-glutamylcyclotransferase (GGCT)/AIG2-like uncharacterized protein YtfP